MVCQLLRFRPLRLLAPLLIGALLSGCTSLSDYIHNGLKVGPNYVKPPAPVASQWIDAADVRVRSEADDLSQWWKAFNDPVLDDLICHAYRQNLSLREAGFRVLQARAQFGIAVGEIFPQTQNVSGNYTRTATSITALTGGSFGSAFGGGGALTTPFSQYFGEVTTNFNLAWELDFWGRFRRSIEASRADLDASVDGYDDVLVTLLGDVATNYVQLRVLQRQIDLLKLNAYLQEEPVRIASAKEKAGALTDLDRAQAKTTLLQIQAQIPQKEIAARVATNRLCVLLGMPPEELQAKLGKNVGAGTAVGGGIAMVQAYKMPVVPAAPEDVAAGIPADLLRRRPDVRRAERQAAAESARIGVAVSQLYPHISINGTFGWQAPHLNQLFTPLAFQGSYGPSFQWDVLNYGRLANNIRFEKAKFEEVVTAYQNKVLTAAEEVENGMALFLKSQEEVKLLHESVVEADKARTIGLSQYLGGKVDGNRLAVLTQNVVAQENLEAQAQGDRALGLIQVYRALGGGWQIRCNGCQPSGAFSPACDVAGPVDAPPADLRAHFGQPLLASVASP